MIFKNGRDRKIYKITMLLDSTYYSIVCTIGLMLVVLNMSREKNPYPMVISTEFHQVTLVNCTKGIFQNISQPLPMKEVLYPTLAKKYLHMT